MYRRSLIRSAAAAGLLPAAARAQSFPSKQLRLLVGAAAGGGADIVARILAQELTKSAGLSVIVDNKPGAGGTVATREALRAPADGYTLLVANVGVLAVIPYATRDAGYDPRADIAPVCLLVDFPNVLVVHPGVPATTLAEYLALGAAAGRHGLRHGGRRHRGPPCRRAFEGEKRRAAEPCAVSRRWAGDERPAGRPRAVRVRQCPHRHRRHARGPHPRAGRHQRPALAVRSRHSDGRRAGLPGLRRHQLVCRRGVVEGADRDHGHVEHAPCPGAQRAEVRDAYGQQGMETLAGTQAEAAAHIARETEVWKKVIADAGIRLE